MLCIRAGGFLFRFRSRCAVRRNVIILFERKIRLPDHPTGDAVLFSLSVDRNEFVRPEADSGKALRQYIRGMQCYAPVCGRQLVIGNPPGCREVLTPGQHGGTLRPRIPENLLRGALHQCAAVSHHDEFIGKTVQLIAAVGDHENQPVIIIQIQHQIILQPVLQIRIQRRERLIQKDDLRLADQNPGQCRALLLAAGQLTGQMVFQSLQTEQFDHLLRFLPAALTIPPLPVLQAAGNILLHGQVRKQRVVLEEISDVPFLRRDIDALL